MSDEDTFMFGAFCLSAGRRELSAHGVPVHLGSRAFDVLLALVRRQGRLATKEELMAEVWPGMVVEESNLQVQVSTLRKILGNKSRDPRYVVTIPGRGYRFVAPVELADAVGSPAAAAERAWCSPSTLPLPDKPSIAVLPFINMSGNSEQDYFADGMAEEILTALTRCSGLFVIARNSSFVYKKRSVDIRQIGRELGVRYILEGSVRLSGSRVRVASQLIDAASGVHIWAGRFDGELIEILDLQDRITENVVAAIEPEIQLAEIERLKHKTHVNLTAYDHLLRAQQLEYEFTEESLEQAVGQLRQALDIDPDYALAAAFAAYCYGWRQTQGWAKDMVAETAEGLRLMTRALELGRFDANVLWLAAVTTWQLGQDHRDALKLAYRSLEMNPNSAIALTIAGRVEALSGNYAKGKELLKRAHRLNPRDPRAWFTVQGMAIACLGEGRFEEGASFARAALVQNPRFTGALLVLAASLAHHGKIEEAAVAVARLLRIEPNFKISRFRSRRKFINEQLWQQVSRGIRLAGLPE
jgi:TolB-like protein